MKKNISLNNYQSLSKRHCVNSFSKNDYLPKPIQLCIMSVCFISLSGCFAFGNSSTAVPEKNRGAQIYVEQSRTIEKLNQKIDDIKKLEAQIARLAKYEAEFSYMFEQLNSLDNNESFVSAKSADLLSKPMDSVFSNNQAQVDNRQSNASPQSFNTNLQTPVIARNINAKVENNRVEVGAADNKFKSMAQTSAQTDETIDAKFASLDTGPQPQQAIIKGRASFANKTDNDSCKTLSGSFALHLVSYSSASKANDGWSDLNNKIADITCDRGARLQEVSVNNKTFYSVRVGPYDSDKDARAVCSLIAKRGHYCGVSEYVGDAI